MIKKLLKNETKENIKLFSDLEIPMQYSSLSKEISIQFHNYTYSSFYNNLKNYHENIKKGNTFNLLSISPYPKIDENKHRKFDIEKMRLAIEKMKEEDELIQRRKKNPYTERDRDSLSYTIYDLLKKKKKIFAKEILRKREHDKKMISPGLGRYNPKYKSIEKHTQNTIFSFNNFKTFNNAYNQKLMVKKRKIKEEDNIFKTKVENMKKKLNKFNFRFKKRHKNHQTIKTNEKSRAKTERNETKSSDIPNLFQNTEVSKKNKNEAKSRNINNHAFSFETYTSRKPLLIHTTYKGDNVFTVSPSVPNIKGNIIFNKKRKNQFSRNYLEEFIQLKKDVPSIGFYRPNYSSVVSKTVDIYFNGKKDQKRNIKYNKLKKILGKYDVTEEYELFNLLNNKKSKTKKLFH